MTEALYTPWRLSYLTMGSADLGGECLFCGLPRLSDADSLIVYRGRSAYVVLNRFPYSNGHVMVAPFAHRGSLLTLPVEERHELVDLGAACEAVLRAEYSPHGLNMGLNVGRSAGAGVADHAHLHVVPRWDGDTSFMTVLSGTRTVPEELATTYTKLSSRFAELRRGGSI